MATRGTYKVENTLLYNHWDNYPAGAANHFLEVIKKYGNLDLFSIIRGMERAEKGTNIYDGSAEFHYVIEKEKITCYSIPCDKNELIHHSSGTIEQWINTAIKSCLEEGDDINDYTVVKISNNRYNTVNGTFEEAKKEFEEAVRMTNLGHTGNGSFQFKNAFKLFKLSTKNFKEYSEIYKRIYVPFFVKAYNHDNDSLFLSYCETEKVA
jgi:hypothetical protein